MGLRYIKINPGFVGILKAMEEKSRIPIRIKTSRMRNNGYLNE
jgi:hypothetical protein